MRVAVALGLLALAGSRQEPPNFAGEWTAISAVGDERAGGFSVMSGGSGHMTITQDATTLTVAWVSFGRSHKPVQSLVSLDGTERRYIDRNSVEPQERSTRARWQGTQLAITTLWAGYTGPGVAVPTPVEVEEILSIESTSTWKVAVTRRVRDQVYRATRIFRRQ
jgi:hypothetical protein